MKDKLENEEFRGKVAFLGETLGPFFLEDPQKGTAQAAFEAIRAIDCAAAGEEWPFVDGAVAGRALALMQEGLAAGIDDDDLVWEYRRLFIGPTIKPAPPWGSVYTDRECVVFGASTLALRQWMRENGIERLGGENDPEDHIGLLLLLLAWLADEKPGCVGQFLADHVLTWSSHFLDGLGAAAAHPFYQGLAVLTKESLEGIQRELGLSVEYPRYYR